MESGATETAPLETRCAECGTILFEGQDRQATDSGVFCRPCFNNLTTQLQQAITAQGQDINYSFAALGGVLGAAAGVLVWWGFTVTTEIAFGLVAIVIGIAVGKGVTIFSGHKRSRGLQILSVSIASVAFFYASYLVSRSFLTRAFEQQGRDFTLPILPDPVLLFRVVQPGFGLMDVVFLGIVVYQAWKIPAPIELGS